MDGTRFLKRDFFSPGLALTFKLDVLRLTSFDGERDWGARDRRDRIMSLMSHLESGSIRLESTYSANRRDTGAASKT